LELFRVSQLFETLHGLIVSSHHHSPPFGVKSADRVKKERSLESSKSEIGESQNADDESQNQQNLRTSGFSDGMSDGGGVMCGRTLCELD